MMGGHPHPQEAEQSQAQGEGKQEWAGFPESFQRSCSAHHGQRLGLELYVALRVFILPCRASLKIQGLRQRPRGRSH